MEKKTSRLYFIDAMRAWAILMMLQGHFIDGLLDTVFRDPNNLVYSIWSYFRGITAPVFFTVSGFIFTYLLIRGDNTGMDNPRIKKGIRRGLQLVLIGYLLRMNLWGLFMGKIYDSFYLVDVLHCIGLSILGIIGIYLLTHKLNKIAFPVVLLSASLLLFTFEPRYATATFEAIPQFLANYISKVNGSVFTIIPWFGYAAFGAFLSILFKRFSDYKYLYPVAIATAVSVGSVLILYSSDAFLYISELTGIQVFRAIHFNNYLFIRLGDVLLVFAVFMLVRSVLKNTTVLKIGQSTLSIYIIHFIILYGSFTGLGLYGFLHHSISPVMVISGALLFMLVCTYAALRYERHKEYIHLNVNSTLRYAWFKMESFLGFGFGLVKNAFSKLLRSLGLLKN
ncbi:DUF1624 domain-containing protein [Maribacter sp.]|nr:DUF1624 domain-containing protein [Maribacter sp.]